MALIALGLRDEPFHDPFHEQPAAVAGHCLVYRQPRGPMDRHLFPKPGPAVSLRMASSVVTVCTSSSTRPGREKSLHAIASLSAPGRQHSHSA